MVAQSTIDRNAAAANRDDAEAVSYTHLDVYKRQMQKLLIVEVILIRKSGESEWINLSCRLPSITSVSYTHLDVYKRQA